MSASGSVAGEAEDLAELFLPPPEGLHWYFGRPGDVLTI
jgi:hypothetical protein